MPDIASVLKSEIARLARKEVRGQIEHLKKANAAHRTQIAALRRQVSALETALKSVRKLASSAEREPSPTPSARKDLRFSAKGLQSQRRRLGLSAADVGLLIGTTGQSIYNWEAGQARPRARHLEAIAALRMLGKKEAAAILAARR